MVLTSLKRETLLEVLAGLLFVLKGGEGWRVELQMVNGGHHVARTPRYEIPREVSYRLLNLPFPFVGPLLFVRRVAQTY
jgi:hypothetical protein